MDNLWGQVLGRVISSLVVVALFITGTILLVQRLADGDAIAKDQGILIFAVSMTAMILVIAAIWVWWLRAR